VSDSPTVSYPERMRLALTSMLLVSLLAACDSGDPAVCSSSSHVVYLNRGGGTFRLGTDDSQTNVSLVMRDDVEEVAGTALDDAAWQQLVSCVRGNFADFDIQVTDIEPAADVEHMELVVTDSVSQDITRFFGINSITSGTTCEVNRAGVGFLFAPTFEGDGVYLCSMAASLVGSMFTLSQTDECGDITSNCAEQTTVLDEERGCETGLCFCSNAPTQNSYQALMELAGPSRCP
jgi:hypothetical protein